MTVLAILSICLQAHSVGAEALSARNIRVIDGDTIDVQSGRFRLVGFDTPETYFAECQYEKALGDAATARLRSLLDSSARIELIILPGRDRYDRGLGRLLIDGQDVRDVLVNEGLARVYDGGRRQPWC